MISKSAERQLKNLGLNSYETKIWVALLCSGQSTAGELSGIANVPRSRSYDVLESLEKKGFVLSKKGKPAKYSAVSPAEAINNHKQKNAEETKTEIKRVEVFKGTQTIRELKKVHARGLAFSNYELSGVLRGEESISAKIAGMIGKSNKNVTISMDPKEFKIFSARFSHVFEEIKGRKISVELIQSGAANMARFCIVDGDEMIFTITDEKAHPAFKIGVWIRSSLARDMTNLLLKNS